MSDESFGVFTGAAMGAGCGCLLLVLAASLWPLLVYSPVAVYLPYSPIIVLAGAALGVVAVLLNRAIDKANPNHPSVKKKHKSEPPLDES